MIHKLSRLFSLPAFLGSFVVALLAIHEPSTAQAHAVPLRCDLNWVLEGNMECFIDECSLSFTYVPVKLPMCGGCCADGTATVTCNGTPTNYPVHLCANCNQSNSQEFLCPNGGIQGQIIMSCKQCPLW